MKSNHTRWRGLISMVLATGVLAGCTATPPPMPGTSAIPPGDDSTSLRTGGASHGGRSDGGSGAGNAVPALPADWPTRIPLPPGLLQGSTGVSPRWSVMLLVGGGATEAVDSAVRFYMSRGFALSGTAQLQGNGYHVVMVAASRDHSATETNLTISVSTP